MNSAKENMPSTVESIAQTADLETDWLCELTHLVEANKIIPADPLVLQRIWADKDAAIPATEKIEVALIAGLDSGTLARAYVGEVEHLVLGKGIAHPQTKNSSDSPTTAFELQVAIDVAQERLLFYRVLLAFGFIGSLLLAREFALFFLT